MQQFPGRQGPILDEERMKKFYLVIVLLFASIIFTKCKNGISDLLPMPENSIVSSDELKIYGKAIDAIHFNSSRDVIYINDTTRKVPSYAIRNYSYIKSSYPIFEEETYNSFLENSKKKLLIKSIPSTLKEKVYLCVRCGDSILDDKLYGLISFSSVGFNKSHTQALVFVTMYAGSWSGSEYYLTFELKNNVWEVQSYILIGMT